MSDRPIHLPPFEPRPGQDRRRPLDGQPIHTDPSRRPVVRRAYEDGTRHTTQTRLHPLDRPFDDLRPIRRRGQDRLRAPWERRGVLVDAFWWIVFAVSFLAFVALCLAQGGGAPWR